MNRRFFFNDTATTEIYALSLHDALPISRVSRPSSTTGSAERVAGRRVGDGPTERGPESVPLLCPLRSGIGRAHVRTPVTPIYRMPSSAWKKKHPPRVVPSDGAGEAPVFS